MQVSPEAIDGYAVSTLYASTTEYVRPRAGPGPRCLGQIRMQ